MVKLLTDYTTQIYHALSTDARPDADPGAQLREIDTGKRFIFDGSAWNELPAGGGGGGITLLASGEYVKASDSAGIEIPISYSGTPVFWYYFNTTPKAGAAQNYLGFTMVGDDPDLDSALLTNGMYMAISDRLVAANGNPSWTNSPQAISLDNNKMTSMRPGATGTHCAGTWKWRIYGRA